MNIGIVCYASVGGSGIIATELGKALAARGHRVHILSSDTPVRLGDYQPGLSFHRVETPSYPLFREPQYLLSLANKIVQVSRDEQLDIVHAHYAIPHATAAYLARQILAADRAGRRAARDHDAARHRHHAARQRPLVFGDRGVLHRAVRRRHGRVGEPARPTRYRELGVTRDIRVIPNFLDCAVAPPRRRRRRCARGWRRARREAADSRVELPAGEARDGGRRGLRARPPATSPARLLMVGDGPDLADASRLARALGRRRPTSQFLGEQDQVVPLLSAADVFLLPSAQESFGLAALEAMACEVPVVASRVGGLPEVIEHGVNGFLHAPDDLDGMAASALAPADRRRSCTGASRPRPRETRRTGRFCDSKIVPLYEAYYEEILAQPDAVNEPAISPHAASACHACKISAMTRVVLCLAAPA